MKLQSVVVLLVAYAAHAIDKSSVKIDIYTHEKCKYCMQLKDFLKARDFTYNNLPLGDDGVTGWSEMQRRAMGCCEQKINEKGKPAKLLTIMPQIFINDEWYGTQRSDDDRMELEKVLNKLTYDVEDSKADHYAAAVDFDEAGDIDSAVESFRAAVKFLPKSTEHWCNLGIALRDEEYSRSSEDSIQKEAVEAFETALKLDPKNELAQEQLGNDREL